MKIGIIISSNDAETSWNAFRYANFCLGQKDAVKVFLTTGKGGGVNTNKSARINSTRLNRWKNSFRAVARYWLAVPASNQGIKKAPKCVLSTRGKTCMK